MEDSVVGALFVERIVEDFEHVTFAGKVYSNHQMTTLEPLLHNVEVPWVERKILRSQRRLYSPIEDLNSRETYYKECP